MCVQSGQCISFRVNERRAGFACRHTRGRVCVGRPDVQGAVFMCCENLGADTSNQLKVFAQLSFSFVLGILSVR